jgi:universal stress protein A
MLSIKTILHATDFSEASRYALGLATSLASDCDAKLVIIHVVAAPVGLPDGVLFQNPEQDREQGPAGLREKLNHLAVPDGRVVIRRIEEGNPALEILNLAHLCHADLIVMGSHGRRGQSRMLMGSVAEAVMRKATCPVLIVTPQLSVLRAPNVGPAT